MSLVVCSVQIRFVAFFSLLRSSHRFSCIFGMAIGPHYVPSELVRIKPAASKAKTNSVTLTSLRLHKRTHEGGMSQWTRDLPDGQTVYAVRVYAERLLDWIYILRSMPFAISCTANVCSFHTSDQFSFCFVCGVAVHRILERPLPFPLHRHTHFFFIHVFVAVAINSTIPCFIFLVVVVVNCVSGSLPGSGYSLPQCPLRKCLVCPFATWMLWVASRQPGKMLNRHKSTQNARVSVISESMHDPSRFDHFLWCIMYHPEPVLSVFSPPKRSARLKRDAIPRHAKNLQK